MSFFSLVCVNQGEEQIRLVDDAFAKICSMMNDLSMRVRKQAASLLGNFSDVSLDFLEQTLDKKLMSNLRVRKKEDIISLNLNTFNLCHFSFCRKKSQLMKEIVKFFNQVNGQVVKSGQMMHHLKISVQVL